MSAPPKVLFEDESLAHVMCEQCPAMESRLLRLLCNRLRMLRDFRAYPEIDDETIVPPLILSGGARTGSTKLHKLLAATGDFNYMTFWQAHTLGLRREGEINESGGKLMTTIRRAMTRLKASSQANDITPFAFSL